MPVCDNCTLDPCECAPNVYPGCDHTFDCGGCSEPALRKREIWVSNRTYGQGLYVGVTETRNGAAHDHRSHYPGKASISRLTTLLKQLPSPHVIIGDDHVGVIYTLEGVI